MRLAFSPPPVRGTQPVHVVHADVVAGGAVPDADQRARVQAGGLPRRLHGPPPMALTSWAQYAASPRNRPSSRGPSVSGSARGSVGASARSRAAEAPTTAAQAITTSVATKAVTAGAASAASRGASTDGGSFRWPVPSSTDIEAVFTDAVPSSARALHAGRISARTDPTSNFRWSANPRSMSPIHNVAGRVSEPPFQQVEVYGARRCQKCKHVFAANDVFCAKCGEPRLQVLAPAGGPVIRAVSPPRPLSEAAPPQVLSGRARAPSPFPAIVQRASLASMPVPRRTHSPLAHGGDPAGPRVAGSWRVSPAALASTAGADHRALSEAAVAVESGHSLLKSQYAAPSSLQSAVPSILSQDPLQTLAQTQPTAQAPEQSSAPQVNSPRKLFLSDVGPLREGGAFPASAAAGDGYPASTDDEASAPEAVTGVSTIIPIDVALGIVALQEEVSTLRDQLDAANSEIAELRRGRDPGYRQRDRERGREQDRERGDESLSTMAAG